MKGSDNASRWSVATLRRPVIQLLLTLLALAGFGTLAYLSRNTKPRFELRGELHHLWAGPVTGSCTLQLASFGSEMGGTSERSWTWELDMADGGFTVRLPDALLNDAQPWVEFVVWCPSLDPSPVVLQPRMALTSTESGPVQASASAWLCVVPHHEAHGEIPLRGATLTLYGKVLDSTLASADEALVTVARQLISFKEYLR